MCLNSKVKQMSVRNKCQKPLHCIQIAQGFKDSCISQSYQEIKSCMNFITKVNNLGKRK